MPTTLKMKSRKGLKSRYASPIMREMQKAELQKIKEPTKQEFQKRVANWGRKPIFIPAIYSKNPNYTSMGVNVVGSEHSVQTWEQLDTKGRKGGKYIFRKKIPLYQKKDGSRWADP